jgi:polar amino acid transport system substrate-binding protein/glutamate/aspartate transport system substrate-binding protein
LQIESPPVKKAAFLTLLGLLCCGAQAQPTDTLKRIQDSKSLRLGYRADAAPFAFQDSGGQPVGYSVDLCKRVAAGLERALKIDTLSVSWVPVTAANRITQVTSGAVDLECGTTTVTLARQEQVDFSNLIFVDGGAVLMRAADGEGKRLADLGGKTLGVMAGTTTETALRATLKDRLIDGRVVIVKDEQDGLSALRDKRIDGLAGDRLSLAGLAVKAGSGSEFALSGDDFSFEPYALMLRRDPAFRLAVNRALSQIYRSDALGEVYGRWFGAIGLPGPLLAAMFYLNAFGE